MTKYRLGFLASGGGSNMQAIIDNCNNEILPCKPAVVISNNSKSGALQKAQLQNIPFYHLSSVHFQDFEQLDFEITKKLKEHNVDYVILAGYMKKIGLNLLNAFPNRVLNIHPALLPKFGGEGMYGMNVHRAVIDAGEKYSGATVHYVDNEYDRGEIILQGRVEIEALDTPETLAEKVLKIEHSLYSSALQKIFSAKFE